PHQAPLAPAPSWTRKPVVADPKESDRSPAPVPIGESIHEGVRNERLFKIACAMRRHGCTFEEMLHALTFINKQRCLPPLSGVELQGIARSAHGYRPSPRTPVPTGSPPSFAGPGGRAGLR